MFSLRTYYSMFLAMICFTAVMLLFCSDDSISGNGPSPTSQSIVNVMVTDSVTGNPIQNASIDIFNAVSGLASSSGTTDSLGSCFLTVNTDTAYYLYVTASEYRSYPIPGTAPDTFQVVVNDTTDRIVELVKIDTPAVVKVVISEDTTKTPIEDASVAIFKADADQPFANGKSDSLGVCFLEVEKGFSYCLNVTAAGYNSYPAEGVDPDTFPVSGSDTTVQAVALTKIDTPTIIKAIINDDSTSEPIKNANVIAYKAGTSIPVANGNSDSLGICLLSVEEGFSYYLRVTALGYFPYPAPGVDPDTFSVAAKDTTVRTVSLTGNDTLTFVKVNVTDDSTAASIDGAKVSLYNEATNQLVGTTKTDNHGICFFCVEGNLYYYILVSADGYFPYPLPLVSPDTFFVVKYDTTERTIALKQKTAQAMVVVSVIEDTTHLPIIGADVVIFDSYTNQAYSREMTNTDGKCSFFVEPVLPYYLKVSAQNYKSSPPPNGAPVPFQVGNSGSVTYHSVTLKKDLTAVDCGTISGYVKSAAGDFIVGCLVVGIRSSDSITVSGISGPDGFYILYNVPAGSYDMEGHLEGWHQETPVTGVQVTSQTVTPDVNIQMTANYGGYLTGRITFLASQNSLIDVTLAHPVSLGSIPGLNTMMNTDLNYRIDSIPPGTYIPWASYRNDGYVMDPDWIRKFGLPLITFLPGDTEKEQNFSVTDAVPIISPTNHPDTLVPIYIFDRTPTFKWEIYPSTHEYIVGVYNTYGDLIWGGYDADNNVLHPQLDSKTDSVVFNFDSSAVEPIRWGHTYRWKVWADKDAAVGVQQFISASEDLMGMFTLGEKKRTME